MHADEILVQGGKGCIRLLVIGVLTKIVKKGLIKHFNSKII